jgi:beta-mannosidase
VWPSCPSGGWSSGVDTLTGLPNGSPLVVAPDWAPPPSVAHAPCGAAGGGGAAAANCTLVTGADYDKGFVGEVFANVPSASACCDLCASAGDARCWAASYWQASCYFKPANKTFTLGAGVVSAFPPGRAPPPLPAPVCEMPEFHGPYTHGYSAQFPMVNGQNDVVHVNLPPQLAAPLAPGQQGTAVCGRFTSEFGASVFSSFESMAPTLPEKNWALWGGEAPCDCPGSPWGRPCIGGNPMAQRNYPGDSFILAFFGPSDFNTTGVAPFQKSLFLNMAAQALEKKGDIEVRRSQNHWGSITWQLNEIYPTGGWGSLEYGTVGFTPQQVVGGRWKPLHHLMASHLYRDVLAVCGDAGVCYVRNDGALAPFAGTVAASLTRFATSEAVPLKAVPVALPRGAFALQYFCLGSGTPEAGCEGVADVLSSAGCAPGACALTLAVDDAGGARVDFNFQLLAAPSQLALPRANVSVDLGPARPGDGAVRVDVRADAFALYVWISTLAQGRFEDNFFAMPAGLRSVYFLPFEGFNATELAATIRVEHVALYM